MTGVAEGGDQEAPTPAHTAATRTDRPSGARSVSAARASLTECFTSRTIVTMHRSSRDPVRRLRLTVDRLPRHAREAMLRGIDANRIIVGAYVDPSSGGICPMLAAHRNGGRTSLASFARAWDEYSGAKRPRRATRREVRTLRALLEESFDGDSEIDRTPITELAAQIRAERELLLERAPERGGDSRAGHGDDPNPPPPTGRRRRPAGGHRARADTPVASRAPVRASSHRAE